MRAPAVCLLISISALATAATPATPEPPHAMTAKELQQICVSADSASKEACKMYILGVTQGISLGLGIADAKRNGGSRPCMPDSATGEELEILIKTKLGSDLTVFPADGDLDASGMIGAILTATLPCDKKPS